MAVVDHGKSGTAPASGMLPSPPKRLEKLEALRGLAALVVIVNHLRAEGYIPIPRLPTLGQEAVIVFFLMSGFVIYYATFARRQLPSFREYFVRRFRRIYPLMLLAMLFTYGMQCIASRALASFDVGNFVGNLLMVQDIPSKRGRWADPFGSDGPLWSLAYEWWFYMLFFPIAIGLRDRRKLQRWTVGIVSVVAAYAYEFLWASPMTMYLSYLVIWWSGVELARQSLEERRITVQRQWPSLLAIALASTPWVIRALQDRAAGKPLLISFEPMAEVRHFAGAVIILSIGLLWNRFHFVGFSRLLQPFAVLAPISYAIYIFHYPILLTLATFPNLPSVLRLLIFLITTVVLGHLLEIKLQPYLNRFVDCIFNTFPKRMPRLAEIADRQAAN